jgi:hypothetical protein
MGWHVAGATRRRARHTTQGCVYMSLYTTSCRQCCRLACCRPGGGRGVVRIRHVRSAHDRPARQPRRRTAPAGNAR